MTTHTGFICNFAVAKQKEMDNLSKHISYLLQRHDCVIVPGIGAFIVTRHDASFDRESNLFLPPRREVSFNRAVISDDGLMAHSYARKYKTLFEEGRLILSKDIEALTRSLASTREYEISGIGKLLLDDEEKISFAPLQNPVGIFQPLSVIPVKGMEVESAPVKAVDDTPEKGIISPQVEETESRGNGSGSLDRDRYYYLAINKTFARLAAGFVLIAAVALSIILPTHSKPAMEDRASVMPVESVIPVVKKTIRIATPPSENDDEHMAFNCEGSENAEEAEAPKYYLIVATFRTEKEANEYVSEHPIKNGSLDVVTFGKMSRVYAACSSDKSELFSRLNSESFRNTYGEGWIWAKK